MQVLPRAGPEPVEAVAADLHRDDAGRAGRDPRDVQAMDGERADHREHDPERDDREERRPVERPPVGARDRLALELVPGGELVVNASATAR